MHKKPMKMILMLGMKVSDECDDERIKARIRTYVRVLKKLQSVDTMLRKLKKS